MQISMFIKIEGESVYQLQVSGTIHVPLFKQPKIHVSVVVEVVSLVVLVVFIAVVVVAVGKPNLKTNAGVKPAAKTATPNNRSSRIERRLLDL